MARFEAKPKHKAQNLKQLKMFEFSLTHNKYMQNFISCLTDILGEWGLEHFTSCQNCYNVCGPDVFVGVLAIKAQILLTFLLGL